MPNLKCCLVVAVAALGDLFVPLGFFFDCSFGLFVGGGGPQCERVPLGCRFVVYFIAQPTCVRRARV